MRLMRKRYLVVMLGAMIAAGCDQTQESADSEGHYVLATDMQQLMSWIIDPSAGVIWGSAGTITTHEGVEDLAPTTAEEWETVRNSAAVLAESGNLMMLPGRAVDDGDWMDFSRGMVTMGQRLVEVADAQDADALFDVGGHLYNVCVACHQIYLLPGQDMPDLN